MKCHNCWVSYHKEVIFKQGFREFSSILLNLVALQKSPFTHASSGWTLSSVNPQNLILILFGMMESEMIQPQAPVSPTSVLSVPQATGIVALKILATVAFPQKS